MIVVCSAGSMRRCLAGACYISAKPSIYPRRKASSLPQMLNSELDQLPSRPFIYRSFYSKQRDEPSMLRLPQKMLCVMFGVFRHSPSQEIPFVCLTQRPYDHLGPQKTHLRHLTDERKQKIFFVLARGDVHIKQRRGALTR